MTLAELLAQPAGIAVAALILGLAVGSFLNVVIARLPTMLEREWRQDCQQYLELPSSDEASAPFNLMVPRSRCPQCGHQIAAWENIPLLSYLVLRGRCSECATRISPQYPLVEAITGILSAVVAWHLGLTWLCAAALLLTWSLIALSAIDLKHQLLPDVIVYPILWLGLLLSVFGGFTEAHSAIIGAAAGYLVLWTVYQLFKRLTGKEGMGYGDFKLLAVLGAWFGWQTLPLIILLSSVAGAAVGLSLIAFRGHDRTVPIPFGPYLAIGGWVAMLWGPQLWSLYPGV